MDIPSKTIRRSRMALAVASVTAYVLLCAWPYSRWAAYPSFFDDDFLRVGSLRRTSLAEALFRPFNEHMAPFFETVSWLAWQGSGRQVLALPTAFLVASFLAFASTTALLGAVVRYETRSTTTALISVAVFCLSAVSAETVLWYSASSFQWAASASLAAWWFSAMAANSVSRRNRTGWMMASVFAAMGAPAFSAIGILAGPLAAIRWLSADHPMPMARRLRGSLLPLIGPALYLLICERFQYGNLVTASVHRNFEPVAAIWAAIRAPSGVLIPSIFGWPAIVGSVPGWLLAVLTGLVLTGSLWRARQNQPRPIILGGLAMIVGGYLLTFATRARPGELWIFEVGRYHLFPQIGMICLIASAIGPRVRRFDAIPSRGWFLAACIAAVLAIPQYPRMQSISDNSYRYPDQPRALAATLRLETLCDREGITLLQAIRALDPIRTRWSPQPWPFHPLLHLFASGPATARSPDALVRPRILAALTIDDREALFGGMEATRYVSPMNHRDKLPTGAVARLIGSQRVMKVGDGKYRVEGWPSHLEFEIAHEARVLAFPKLKTEHEVEIWWAGEEGTWSPYRSLRWKPNPDRPDVDWAVSLEAIPHWRPGFARRLRIVFHEWGIVTLEEPRFLLEKAN